MEQDLWSVPIKIDRIIQCYTMTISPDNQSVFLGLRYDDGLSIMMINLITHKFYRHHLGDGRISKIQCSDQCDQIVVSDLSVPTIFFDVINTIDTYRLDPSYRINRNIYWCYLHTKDKSARAWFSPYSNEFSEIFIYTKVTITDKFPINILTQTLYAFSYQSVEKKLIAVDDSYIFYLWDLATKQLDHKIQLNGIPTNPFHTMCSIIYRQVFDPDLVQRLRQVKN